jgi:hypothetical protein
MLTTAVNANNDPIPLTQVEPTDSILTIFILPVYIPFVEFAGLILLPA